MGNGNVQPLLNARRWEGIVGFVTNCYGSDKWRGRGYKLYCYITVIKKMIDKIL